MLLHFVLHFASFCSISHYAYASFGRYAYLKIIIYGAGNYAVDLYLLLKKQYINIMGFAVTERSRNVALIDGKPVLPAEEWMWDRDEALILLGCSDSFKERVVKHLDELGFGNVMSV